jgi:hypothetical protein
MFIENYLRDISIASAWKVEVKKSSTQPKPKWITPGAPSLTIQGIVDPSVLEVMACREALAVVEDIHLQKVVVASDCLTVISYMEKPFEARYSMIFQEIKSK